MAARQPGPTARKTRPVELAGPGHYPRRWVITGARVLDGYRVHLSFADGYAGTIDLRVHLHGEVFEPLRDVTRFGQGCFDASAGTLVWPNGADFAPEFLRELAEAAAGAQP